MPDAKIGMSMADDHDADDFDRQFEPNVAKRCEHCWTQHH